jgi:Holliday junction resolvasome RuvABC endonuclease subunit
MKTGLVLGIDPGLPQTGYALADNGVILPYWCGVWRHGPAEGDEEERQWRYGMDLLGLLAALRQREMTVDLLATEAQFQRRYHPEANARSLIAVSAMRGYFVGYCNARGMRAVKVPANVAFRALIGNARADADQRREAVGKILGRELKKGEIHLADAAAFALAGGARVEVRIRVDAARARDALEEAEKRFLTAGTAYDATHGGGEKKRKVRYPVT